MKQIGGSSWYWGNVNEPTDIVRAVKELEDAGKIIIDIVPVNDGEYGLRLVLIRALGG